MSANAGRAANNNIPATIARSIRFSKTDLDFISAPHDLHDYSESDLKTLPGPNASTTKFCLQRGDLRIKPFIRPEIRNAIENSCLHLLFGTSDLPPPEKLDVTRWRSGAQRDLGQYPAQAAGLKTLRLRSDKTGCPRGPTRHRIGTRCGFSRPPHSENPHHRWAAGRRRQSHSMTA